MLFLFYFIWLSHLTFVTSQSPRRRVCPPPPGFLFGKLNRGGRRVGSIRTYTCADGFQPMGDPSIRCQQDQTWTQLHLACLACPEPDGVFGCGNIMPGPNTLQATREYKCTGVSGHHEPVTTTCLPGTQGPTWSLPANKCPGCTSSSVTQNGSLDPPIIKPRPVVAFLCDSGLVAIGPGEVSCVDSIGGPVWTKPVQGCAATAHSALIEDSCKSNPCLNGGKCINALTGFKCVCNGGYVGTICEGLKTDCKEILSSGTGKVTGVYTVQPSGSEKFKVLCDMETDGGGWTVIQSRMDVKTTDFKKLWTDYEQGFGTMDQAQSFWLGLEKIYKLTKQGIYEIRMEMEKRDGVKAAAIYQDFALDDRMTGYKLKIGAYSYDNAPGFVNPGDSFTYHNGGMFTTIDNPSAGFNAGVTYIGCGTYAQGGWWYKMTKCYTADLNGATAWETFDGWNPLSKTKIMIRKK